MKPCNLVAACLALGIAAPAVAQETTPERMQNVSWHSVSFVKFHPGKRERAMEIVETYFAPAGQDAGLPDPYGVHFNTGSWDVVYSFPMTGGPNDLTWDRSPEDIKWMAALAQRAGGREAAERLLAEFDTLVAREERHIAHKHPNW